MGFINPGSTLNVIIRLEYLSKLCHWTRPPVFFPSCCSSPSKLVDWRVNMIRKAATHSGICSLPNTTKGWHPFIFCSWSELKRKAWLQQCDPSWWKKHYSRPIGFRSHCIVKFARYALPAAFLEFWWHLGGGFLKWWVSPNNFHGVFLLKIIILGCEMGGTTIYGKHPSENIRTFIKYI